MSTPPPGDDYAAGLARRQAAHQASESAHIHLAVNASPAERSAARRTTKKTAAAKGAAKKAAAKKTTAAAAKTASGRVVVNRAGAGATVPIQAGRIEGSTTVRGGAAKKTTASKSAKKSAPRTGSGPSKVVNIGPAAVQAGNINGAHVVINSTSQARPSAPAKKAPAKKVAPPADAQSRAALAAAKKSARTPSDGSERLAEAVDAVKRDQQRAAVPAKKTAAPTAATAAKKTAAKKTAAPAGAQTLAKKTAAKKTAAKPRRRPISARARAQRIHRHLRWARKHPVLAAVALTIYGGRLARRGASAPWRAALRRFKARQARARQARPGRGSGRAVVSTHADCPRCKGTGVIPIHVNGRLAGSTPCPAPPSNPTPTHSAITRH